MEIPSFYKFNTKHFCVNSHENTSGSRDNLSDDRSCKVQFSDPTNGHFHIC